MRDIKELLEVVRGVIILDHFKYGLCKELRDLTWRSEISLNESFIVDDYFRENLPGRIFRYNNEPADEPDQFCWRVGERSPGLNG